MIPYTSKWRHFRFCIVWENRTCCNDPWMCRKRLTNSPLWHVAVNLNVQFSNDIYLRISWSFPMKLTKCRQATSHYLSQCCPGSISPYSVTKPEWVKKGIPTRRRSVFFYETSHFREMVRQRRGRIAKFRVSNTPNYLAFEKQMVAFSTSYQFLKYVNKFIEG